MAKCSVKDCLFDEDTHAAGVWCKGIPDVPHTEGYTHQHIPKKGMGGNNPNSKIRALLCSYCHDRIDNGDWGNSVSEFIDDGPDGMRNGYFYRAWNLHGGTLIERQVYLDGLENNTLIERELSGVPTNAVVERDTVDTGVRRAGVVHPDPVSGGVRSPAPSALATVPDLGATELTRGECIARARALREERERNPWSIGDLLLNARALDDPDNSWDAETGASLTDILGIQHETAGQYERLAGQFPPPRLASMGHAQACYKQPDADQWMKLAYENNWSVSRLRQEIRGGEPEPKAKVRRWTIEELRERWKFWEAHGVAYSSVLAVEFFLDWLERVE